MSSPSSFVGFHQVIEPEEPSAVDYLAAIADPDGEAAQRVRMWTTRPAEPTFTVTFVDDVNWELPPGVTSTIATQPRKRKRRCKRRRKRRRR